MNDLTTLTKHVDDLAGRVTLIAHETDGENASLWEAVRELRRAVNRLEQLHGTQAQTQWVVQDGSPRHPDSGPELGV